MAIVNSYVSLIINKQLYVKTLCTPMPPMIVGSRHGIPITYHDPNKYHCSHKKGDLSTTIFPNRWVNPQKKPLDISTIHVFCAIKIP